MGMLQTWEAKTMRKKEVLPLWSFSSPISPTKWRKMDVTLAACPSVLYDTIRKILYEYLDLSKKSDRWMSKLLSPTGAVVGDWFAAESIQRLKHWPNTSYWAPLDIFLLFHMKEALAGHTLPADSQKTGWGAGSPPRPPLKRMSPSSVSGMSAVFCGSS